MPCDSSERDLRLPTRDACFLGGNFIQCHPTFLRKPTFTWRGPQFMSLFSRTCGGIALAPNLAEPTGHFYSKHTKMKSHSEIKSHSSQKKNLKKNKKKTERERQEDDDYHYV